MKSQKQAKREAKQLCHFCTAGGPPDVSRVGQVAQLLAGMDNRDSRKVLGHFLRLVQLESARYTGTIETATPLAPDLEAAIRAGLARRFGDGLTLTFTHQPALIGGVRIQVGSDVYDGSVRAGLAALDKSF